MVINYGRDIRSYRNDKKAESDVEQLILDSESKSVDMINESKINAENIINEAKKQQKKKLKILF